MAVNFGDTLMEGRIEPEVQQQAPVQDRSGLYLAEAAGAALQGVGQVFGEVVKGQMQAEANSVLNAYRQEAVLLADSVDQGGLSLQAARSRLRVLYSNAIANNPALAGEIDKLHSTLMDQYGIGSVIQEGNEETQRQQNLADAAYAAGWGDNVDGYTHWQNVVRQEEGTLRTLSVRAAQRGELSALEEERLMRSISNMAEAGYPWVQQQVQNAAKMIDEGTDPAEVIAMLRADVGGVINQFTTSSQGKDISYITDPMNNLLQTFEDYALGKISQEVMNNEVARINAVNEYVLMSDEDTARAVAVSNIFGQNAQAILRNEASRLAVDIFGRNSSSYDPDADDNPRPANIIGTDGNIRTYFNSLEEDMSAVIDRGATPEQEAEVGNQITNILRSVGKNGADGVRDYRNVVDFFASDGVRKWVESGRLPVPANVQEEAVLALQDNYANVLTPLVEERWYGDARTYAMGADPNTVGDWGRSSPAVNEVIDAVWNGASVTFQPKAGFEDDARVVGIARELNQGENSIAVPLNTLIRAKAHMSGTTDYNGEWQWFEQRLFSPNEEGVETNTETSEIEIEEVGEELGDQAPRRPDEPVADEVPLASLEDFNAEMALAYAPTREQPAALRAIEGALDDGIINTPEFQNYYREIRGKANLMSSNPARWGRNSNTREWQLENLTTIRTPSGKGAQVNKAAAPYFQGFINELESMGYKVEQFGGYNYRTKRGGSSLSEHAFGNAIDINWSRNPMTKNLVTDMPENISQIAAKYGLSWGGDWNSVKDAMHFEWTGRVPPTLTASR